MDKRYRIIISGKKLYKEIEVSPESKLIRFGTESNCDVRVRKDLFFEPIELTFSKDIQNQWKVMCSDNLYICVDDVRKLLTVPIQHGTELLLKYQNSSSDALYIQFLIDFDYEYKKYDRMYEVASLKSFSIGSTQDCNLILSGAFTSHDRVFFGKKDDGLELSVQSTTFGVYHNGNLVERTTFIKNGDFFSIGNFSFYYKNEHIFTQKTDEIKGNGVSYVDSTERSRYPKFNRNSRIKTVLDDTKIEILDPPAIPRKPKSNIISRLLPSVVMIVVSLIVGLQGGFFILISMASSVVGVITAIMGFRQAKKDYNQEFTNRITKYNAYIENKRNELNQDRLEELRVLQDKYISEQEEIDRLKKFSYKLFDRCKEDEDFLEVRLGIGKFEAKREVNYRKQERLEIEDDLQTYPEKVYEQYKYINEAPIVCDFKAANAVGIVGDEKSRFNLMKNMIVDICARQYHSDVDFYFVAEKANRDKIHWLRMLPQVHNDILGIHNIVCDDNSRTIIFEYLYKELTYREQNKEKYPHIIVFLYDEYGFKSHPLSRFVEHAKEIGVTFVFFGTTRADIGLGCDYLIENISGNKARLMETSDSRKVYEFTYNTISDGDITAMVQLLAPVYTEEISLEGTLTKNISLFELLNIIAVDDIDLNARWNTSKVYQSMSAPIGVSKSGVIFLDLHDKAHGPHGLVAGTTGAGKSEILQTYIMSMATLYHPYEVGFVIIDFKGGGMANQFKDLPHMMGTITNIDGKEINRSLKSIKAELKKRQRLFAEVEVNHIDKYIMKFRDGEASIPLPHLILIVDEFAELKAEQPDFMKELISAARIGRSLGVHLILATQKPSGQVDEQIWSNSRFKLCLKVQSQQDSNEVLKSPLAAEIKEPGRAYLQVGNNEIFELFQSAYSGAPEHVDDSGMKEFTIYEISDSGKKIPVYQQKKKQENGNDKTQLDALVQYVKTYCDSTGLYKLPNICLPSLRQVIDFPQKEELGKLQHHIIADIYMAFSGEREIEKIEKVKEYIHTLNQDYREQRAKTIPAVPSILTETVWEQNYGKQSDKEVFYMGLNYEGVEPLFLKWINQSIIGIVGDSLKEAFLQYLQFSFVKHGYQMYIIDDYTGEFETISECDGVQLYSRNVEDSQEILSDLIAELEQRRVLREVQGIQAVMDMTPIIMMIHNNDWPEYVSNNREMLNCYKDILEKYKGLKCLILFTNLANERLNEFQVCEVLKTVKKKQNYIVFKNIKDIEVFDTTSKERQLYGSALQEGDAFTLLDNVLSKVKTITLN